MYDKISVIWHTLESVKAETNKAKLTAIALDSWANCMAGNKPPEWFGEMMVIIGERLGISPTAENVMAYAKRKGYEEAPS